ncbi:hypothetical protein [Acidicapsa ligni]|uniref:hypothetical protein n=1 Tax=Acidicapsa ligni TaxID=542300 RepID=UPI0021DF4673|nr:hypothetical protein [Acidicapsa ligni]
MRAICLLLLTATSVVFAQQPQIVPTSERATYSNDALGFSVSYPTLLSQKDNEDLITAMRRFGSTIDPEFMSEEKQNALPPACVHTLFHVSTPDNTSIPLVLRRGAEKTPTSVHMELIVSEFDRKCLTDQFGSAPTDPKEKKEMEELLETIGPAMLLDQLVQGYGFDPLEVMKQSKPGYTRMENFNAVMYMLAEHKAYGWIGQVTPNQSYDEAKGEKPPKVKWWDDIRTITALDTVVQLGDKLIMIQSFSGPVAALGASRDVSVRFGSGTETPIYSFPIQSLDLKTGQGIDLDTNR